MLLVVPSQSPRAQYTHRRRHGCPSDMFTHQEPSTHTGSHQPPSTRIYSPQEASNHVIAHRHDETFLLTVDASEQPLMTAGMTNSLGD